MDTDQFFGGVAAMAQAGPGDAAEQLQMVRNVNAILKLFVVHTTRKGYLDDVVRVLHACTGCEAVGIRVLNKDGDIPFESYRGFSKEFWEAENFLSVGEHRCVCTRVVTGRPDPADMPYMTRNGSFHCSDTGALLCTRRAGGDPSAFRGMCAAFGYKSLTLVPIHRLGGILGAIYLADRTGDISPATLAFLESIERLVGEAVRRLDLEEELHRSEEKYRSIFENAQEGIFQVTADGNYLSINPRLARMFGYGSPDEMMTYANGWQGHECMSPESRRELHGLVRNCPVEGFTVRAYRRDGEELWITMNCRAVRDGSGAIRYYEGTVSDVTEQKRAQDERDRLEQRLRHSQKMEAFGILAGGIAHDFNNILAAIIGFAEFAKSRAGEGVLQRPLQRILDAGLRGRELVKQILTFARRSDQEKKPLRLDSLVTETLQLLRASLPSTIDIQCRVSSGPGLVLADRGQLQQVLMNLATNAAQAMPGQGGTVTIEVSETIFPSASDVPDPTMSPGAYMRLSVTDTGKGMTPEVIDRIFDPFFTTKKPGEGTGLGLSVVQGIVQGHGGAVFAQSRLNEGSTFSVYLPKLDLKDFMVPEEEEQPVPGGKERILFVDDEEALTEAAHDMLGDLGYRVTATTSPNAALGFFRENPDGFDLLITDQTMPGLTGLELVREVLALRRDLPVILCTGYSNLVTGDTAREAGVRAFATKPLVKAELGRMVRRVLDG
jgi:PAS domain S-box-containing protein